jgi:mRNA interferase MazF
LPRIRTSANGERRAVHAGDIALETWLADGANATAARLGRGVVTVVPVTSNVRQVYPFQALLPAAECGLERDSKAQAEQVRSVAVERLGDVLGRVPQELMRTVDDALRLHLEL